MQENEKILDGKETAKQIRIELKRYVKTKKQKPEMAVIQVGKNPASNSYIKGKGKAAEKIGIIFHHFKYEETVTTEELLNKINELNLDKHMNGIMVQLPIPNHLDKIKILNAILPEKDVDGLSIMNNGLAYCGEDALFPCTPLGVIELLKRNQIEIKGKHVVIVGRSNLVGKPLFNLFLKENATVTICHSHTKNLKEMTKQADILVVAIGKAKFITKDMVKEGAIVVDVGISSVDGKLEGDVDFTNVYPISSRITPVPGGVGPMTVAMLMSNVVKSYQKNH